MVHLDAIELSPIWSQIRRGIGFRWKGKERGIWEGEEKGNIFPCLFRVEKNLV